ncbi:MAG: HYC_CC_PP family protein, partial [Flavobacteriaceae bacterium]
MALAVVLASFSFKIEQHFCGSNLVDVSVLSK